MAQVLKYTATTGRLPIKRGDGKIEAEMFFVAYTLDGAGCGEASADVCVQWRARVGDRSGCTWARWGLGMLR